MFTTSLQIQAAAEIELRTRIRQLKNEIPNQTLDWLTFFFPKLFYHEFTDRHKEFWGHIDKIMPGEKPPAFFGIWPRASGKTTNAEAAAVRLGSNEKRKFCLYTRVTQDKANESVSNISSMIEGDLISLHYPDFSRRKTGKYGRSRGWNIKTLRCDNGFNVTALGYDAAVRGIKFDEYRPDLIIIDDIDDPTDTLESIQKKINTLTRDILPAGSSDCAMIGIQNLIGYNGIFTQISNGKANFLLDRIVSGPYQAVDGLEYEMGADNLYHITAGSATWSGQDITTCEVNLNEWGPTSFLQEAQNIIIKKEGRVFYEFNDVGPASYELDMSNAQGYYHSHDFGSVNNVWGMWAKIRGSYYLIHSEKLPELTTVDKAKKIKSHFANRKIIAGWGGAKGEKQQRLDFIKAGVKIRLPIVTDVESQIDVTNHLLKTGQLVICSDQLEAIDQLENCIRDDKEGIQDKSIWHFCDMIRYFAAGISKRGWAR